MRKTSHDGADSSSVTSGIENETKKSGGAFTKMKKNSIKRKVQNFSHDSDDGIIEPLLQTDKEKSEIANRSAKFLLNKSKTDSSYEKEKRHSESFDKCSVSTPVSSATNIISNNVRDNQMSTSYICGSAPIHNHMNTNVFGGHETSRGILTTKSSILVEIDGSKSAGYTPSPLIFTTAKIHTDSKTKLMEPVHVTPVPILSTIEGSVIKSGFFHEADKTSIDVKKILNKDELNIKKDIQLPSLPTIQPYESTTEVLPFIRTCNSVENKKQLEEKRETPENKTLNECDSLLKKEQNMSQLSYNTPSLGIVSASNTLTRNGIPIKKEILNNSKDLSSKNDKSGLMPVTSNSITNQITTEHRNEILNISKDLLSNISKSGQMSVSSNSITNQITTEQNRLIDKTKENIEHYSIEQGDKNKDPKLAIDSQLQNKCQPLKSPDLEPSNVNDSTPALKNVSSGSKKLQRQKNTALSETNKTDSKTLTTNVNIIKESDKHMETLKKIETSKCDGSTNSIAQVNARLSGKNTAVECTSTKSLTTSTSIITIDKPIAAMTSSSTSKANLSTEKVKSPSGSKLENDSKKLSKPSIAQLPPSTSKDVCPTLTKPSTKLITKSTESQQDSVFSAKADSATKHTSSAISATVPPYIVSTSKTKIGITLTSNTSTSTTKAETQKKIAEGINTTSELGKSVTPSGKLSTTTSSNNGTKFPNVTKPTNLKHESNKKGSRA